MKKIIAYTIIIFSSFFSSCSNDDNGCELVLCAISDTALRFDLINEATRNNIFVDSLFEPNLLKIFNTDNLREEIEYQFLDTENYIVSINPILLTPDIKNYTFTLSDEIILKLKTETIADDPPGCCSFFSYSKIEISEAEVTINSQNGNFEIIIE